VDDIGWRADGKDDDAVTAKLSEAAAAGNGQRNGLWQRKNRGGDLSRKETSYRSGEGWPTPSHSTRRRRIGLESG